ncbi:peptidase S8/S53 domain-containing protein, partial [Blastocladiella britannica]
NVKRITPVTIYDLPEPLAGAAASTLPDAPFPQYAHQLTGVDKVRAQSPELTGANVLVGIVDSGIDWKHPAFAIPGQECTEFKGPGCRVQFGRDFVGDAYDSAGKKGSATPTPDADPMDCGGHGTHCAGIVGGNDPKVQGVAPGATFGAYRVFGCDGSTGTDVILSALEAAYEDGMQVINMSLGGGRVDSSYPEAQAVTTLGENGVYVMIAAGNDGDKGIQVVSSPSIATGAMSIASFDNNVVLQYTAKIAGAKDLTTIAFAYSGTDGVTATFPNATPFAIANSNKPIDATDDGCVAFPADQFKGKIALVKRGSCAFTDKVKNAQAAGAVGVFIRNNLDEDLAGGVLDPLVVKVPVGFVGGALGKQLYAAAAAAPITISFNPKQEFLKSATAGRPSSFSNWGLDLNLRMKPDVGAPGGNIFSTYPLAKGGYTQMSGTSMATPYMVGVLALEVQKNGASKGIESLQDVQRRLHVTARPFAIPGDVAGSFESVAKVGAGLVDALAFLNNAVSVSPSKLELGDLAAYPKGPVKTADIVVRNDGKTAVTYTLTHTASRSVMGDNGVLTAAFATSSIHARVTFDKPTITVAPGQSATVKVSVNGNVPVIGSFPVPGHWVLSGYVTLQTADRKSSLNVPYSLMTGDYSKMPLVASTGDLSPALSNGLVTLLPSAPIFDGKVEPVFDLSKYNASSPITLQNVPAIRLATVFPTRQLAVGVHDASKPELPILGYLLSAEYLNALNAKAFRVPFVGGFYKSLADAGQEDPATLVAAPNGKYAISILMVKPNTNGPVADAAAALSPAWVSPKFTVKGL